MKDSIVEDNPLLSPKHQRGCGKQYCWPVVLAFIAVIWHSFSHPAYYLHLVVLDAILSASFIAQVCLQPAGPRCPPVSQGCIWGACEYCASTFCAAISICTVLSAFFHVAVPQWVHDVEFLTAFLRLSYFLHLPSRFRSCSQQLVLVDMPPEADVCSTERRRLLSQLSFQYAQPGSYSGPNAFSSAHCMYSLPQAGGVFHPDISDELAFLTPKEEEALKAEHLGLQLPEPLGHPNPFAPPYSLKVVPSTSVASLGLDPGSYHSYS